MYICICLLEFGRHVSHAYIFMYIYTYIYIHSKVLLSIGQETSAARYSATLSWSVSQATLGPLR